MKNNCPNCGSGLNADLETELDMLEKLRSNQNLLAFIEPSREGWQARLNVADAAHHLSLLLASGVKKHEGIL